MDYGKRCKTNDRIPICQRISRRTVIAAVILSVVLLIAWHAIVPSTSDAEKFDPMPTPEEACAEFAQGSEYNQVEFAGFENLKMIQLIMKAIDFLQDGWAMKFVRVLSQISTMRIPSTFIPASTSKPPTNGMQSWYLHLPHVSLDGTTSAKVS